MSILSWLATLLHVMTHTVPQGDGTSPRETMMVTKEAEEGDPGIIHALAPPLPHGGDPQHTYFYPLAQTKCHNHTQGHAILPGVRRDEST